MEQTTPRAFTRADVEQFFLKAFSTSAQTYEVKEVALLPGLTPPAWIIYHEAVWGKDSSTEHRYPGQCVVYQRRDFGEMYLYFSVEEDLPQGLASPAEEDAEIARRKAEMHAAWEKREQAKHTETA